MRYPKYRELLKNPMLFFIYATEITKESLIETWALGCAHPELMYYEMNSFLAHKEYTLEEIEYILSMPKMKNKYFLDNVVFITNGIIGDANGLLKVIETMSSLSCAQINFMSLPVRTQTKDIIRMDLSILADRIKECVEDNPIPYESDDN